MAGTPPNPGTDGKAASTLHTENCAHQHSHSLRMHRVTIPAQSPRRVGTARPPTYKTAPHQKKKKAASVRTCGDTESEAGGNQMALKPASAISAACPASFLYHASLLDSQLKPCARWWDGIEGWNRALQSGTKGLLAACARRPCLIPT